MTRAEELRDQLNQLKNRPLCCVSLYTIKKDFPELYHDLTWMFVEIDEVKMEFDPNLGQWVIVKEFSQDNVRYMARRRKR